MLIANVFRKFAWVLIPAGLSAPRGIVGQESADSAEVYYGEAGRTVLNREDLAQFPLGTSLGEILRALVPGIIGASTGQAGGDVQIVFGGPVSLIGVQYPLVVVDGAVLTTGEDMAVWAKQTFGIGDRLAAIEPQDVQRLEVLEPFRAIGRFGAQARGGAIIVTTRDMDAGPLRFSFSFTTGRASTPGIYRLNTAATAGRYDTAPLGDPVTRYDVQDSIFRVGVHQAGHFDVSGSAGGFGYFASVGRTAENGIVRTTSYSQNVGRVGLGYRLDDWMVLRLNAATTSQGYGYVAAGGVSPSFLALLHPTSLKLYADTLTGRYPGVRNVNPLESFALTDLSYASQKSNVGFRGTLTLPHSVTVDISTQWDRAKDHNTAIVFDIIGNRFQSDSTSFETWRRTDNVAMTYTAQFASDMTSSTSIGYRRISGLDSLENWESWVGIIPLAPTFVLADSLAPRVQWSLSEVVTYNDRIRVEAGLLWDRRAVFFGYGMATAFFDQWRQWVPWIGANLVAIPEKLRFGFVYQATLNKFHTNDSEAEPLLRPELHDEIRLSVDGSPSPYANVDFSLFHRHTNGAIWQVLRPIGGGNFVPEFRNVGFIDNIGASLSVSGDVFRGERIGWKIGASIGWQVNSLDSLTSGGNPQLTGTPVGSFLGLKYARDADGMPIYLDSITPLLAEDTLPGGVITNQFALGDPFPNVTMSVVNNFAIGSGFRALVVIDGQFGHQALNQARRWGEFYGALSSAEREIAGDTVMGTYTLNTARRNITEEFVDNADFVKLRMLSVSWRLPAWFGSITVLNRGVWLTVTGRNLFTISPYDGPDPEAAAHGSTWDRTGADFAVIGNPRMLSVGLSVRY